MGSKELRKKLNKEDGARFLEVQILDIDGDGKVCLESKIKYIWSSDQKKPCIIVLKNSFFKMKIECCKHIYLSLSK